MQLYGNGVTKNFLAILETEISRAGKTVTRLVVLASILALVGIAAVYKEWTLGTLLVVAAFALATLLGVAWGHFVNTYRYQVSIREHWNRWMRFSVSCVSVRECYAKVHGHRAGPNLWWTSVFIALLICAHLVIPLLALNESATIWNILPLFLLDALLLGFLVGVRWRERRWYREFLRSVNELLEEGTIGVWGVY
jgi:hypothetical protein